MKILALLFVVALARPVAAEFVVPKLTGPVVDTGDMISESTERRLTGFLFSLAQASGTQLTVATVPNLGGLEIEQASIKITDAWKLGTAKDDQGVLLLLARDERKLRIEVGQGLEGVLPDVVASRIIREVMVPQLKAGDSDQAVIDGVVAIVQKTNPEYLENAPATSRGASRPSRASEGGIGKLIMYLIFFFLIMPMLLGRRGGRAFLLGALLGGMSGRRGGFGGGGGGWGGGGGGFSGGGASGSW